MYNLIKKIPILNTYIDHKRTSSDNRIISELGNSQHPMNKFLYQVLRGETTTDDDKKVISDIEKQRGYLLDNHEPLVKPELGERGLCDRNPSVARVCAKASVTFARAIVIYRLVRIFKPLNVLELGTNVGISSAYLASALKLNNNGGKLITIEASPHRIAVAKNVHNNLQLRNISYAQGTFYETLPGILKHNNFQAAFIDGHHQFHPTLDYFDLIYRKLDPDSVVVFDDITWSSGMKRAWYEIRNDKRVNIALDLKNIGLCIVKSRYRDEKYIYPRIHNVFRDINKSLL